VVVCVVVILGAITTSAKGLQIPFIIGPTGRMWNYMVNLKLYIIICLWGGTTSLALKPCFVENLITSVLANPFPLY